ncbi:MAG: class I SAM-dependent methyltransferase [Crocinitomicaceae bacterium]|nr:class I SAM-dependent methyltransferase [Crocinitomicaceae bacterium]
MSYLTTIKRSILESIQDGLLSEETGVLTGLSGEKLVGTLQRLAKNTLTEDTVYLEVGVYQGFTLLSVAKEIGERKAYGIDNFAFFDREGKNFGIVKERIEKLGLTNAFIINKDYEDALENLDKELNGKKVGVYFIDGPHDYRSQLMCLALIKPFLADNAVILVDDSNYRHVRQANRDFLVMHPEFKMVFEAYTSVHPLNLEESARAEHKKGWWDGVNIIVKDPANELTPMYPPTLRDRSLYENDHAVHSTKHPEVVPYAFKLVNWVAPIVYKFSKLKNKKDVIRGKYKAMNVYSEKLVGEKYNDSLPNP